MTGKAAAAGRRIGRAREPAVLDIRRYRVARLSERYGRKTFKRLRGRRRAAESSDAG